MFRQVLHSSNTYVFLVLLGVFAALFLYGDARTRVAIALDGKVEQAAVALMAQSSDVPLADKAAEEISIVHEKLVSKEDNTDVKGEIQTLLEIGAISYEELQKGGSVDESVFTSQNADLDKEETDEIQLPYTQDVFVEGGEWGGGYGTYVFKNNHLIVGGGKKDSASLVLFQGGKHLNTYTFTTLLDWHHGSSLSLIARFYDYDNYVTCSYGTSGAQVSIISVESGERRIHGSSSSLPIKSYDSWKDLNFGARVSGNSLECLINGEVVLRNDIQSMKETGTVGISVWSNNPGEALATLRNVQIEAYEE